MSLGASFFESPGAWLWEATHPQEIREENTALGVASPQVVDAVDRFRQAAQNFSAAYDAFWNNSEAAFNAGYGEEWNALNDRAITAQNYIRQVGEAVSNAWGWAKQTFGLAGLHGALGALPAIPIAYAVIAAALAWVVSITADMVSFNRRMDAVKSGTMTPGEAFPQGQGGATQDMATMIKWGVAGAVALAVLPTVLRAWERK